MHRVSAALYALWFLALCWLGMMAVHELGHLIGAWLTGAVVSRVILHPLTISQTQLSDNPAPQMVAWSGPLLGVILPLVVFALSRVLRLRIEHLFRFFAGFCLIANGAYIGMGSQDGIGDAGDLVRHGAQKWQLWTFGLACIPLGFLLWHRQGKQFGLGPGGRQIFVRDAGRMFILLLVVVLLECLLS